MLEKDIEIVEEFMDWKIPDENRLSNNTDYCKYRNECEKSKRSCINSVVEFCLEYEKRERRKR